MSISEAAWATLRRSDLALGSWAYDRVRTTVRATGAAGRAETEDRRIERIIVCWVWVGVEWVGRLKEIVYE